MGLRKHHLEQSLWRWWNSSWAFQILKDDAVKVLHSICQQIWKPQQCPQDCKRSVFIPVPKKGNAKECSNYHRIALISHASKVMLKILQARLQQYVNCELPDIQASFRKGRGTRDQIVNICWIIEKAREFQKNIYFCFIDYAKAFDCVDHNKLWKILKENLWSTIWSLVPLPFLNPVWTSGSSQFIYCWSLAWRILSITLVACEMSAFLW